MMHYCGGAVAGCAQVRNLLFAITMGGAPEELELADPRKSVDMGAAAVKMFISLVIIAGAIIIVSYLLRKSYFSGSAGKGNHSFIKIMTVVPLGEKRLLTLVSAGDKLLLLGVTTQTINLLGEYSKEEVSEELLFEQGKKSVVPFAKILRKSFLKRGSVKKASLTSSQSVKG